MDIGHREDTGGVEAVAGMHREVVILNDFQVDGGGKGGGVRVDPVVGVAVTVGGGIRPLGVIGVRRVVDLPVFLVVMEVPRTGIVIVPSLDRLGITALTGQDDAGDGLDGAIRSGRGDISGVTIIVAQHRLAIASIDHIAPFPRATAWITERNRDNIRELGGLGACPDHQFSAGCDLRS